MCPKSTIKKTKWHELKQALRITPALRYGETNLMTASAIFGRLGVLFTKCAALNPLFRDMIWMTCIKMSKEASFKIFQEFTVRN